VVFNQKTDKVNDDRLGIKLSLQNEENNVEIYDEDTLFAYFALWI
jgi:hypothetical protein